MAEEPTPQDIILPTPAASHPEQVTESVGTTEKDEVPVAQTIESAKEVARTSPAVDNALKPPVAPTSAEHSKPELSVEKGHENIANKSTPEVPENEHKTTQEDVNADIEMKQDNSAPTAALTAEPADDGGVVTEASASKSKTPNRRKSGGVPEHKSNKKLNKKASKAKLTHVDAKPGDYFMIRLKGYPLWPGVVCDETMLPNTLLKNRPVTAARPDGSYREDYADGGPKVKDRTFPVMYLHTNEFSWIPNTDLVDMDFDSVGNITSSMRKDLSAAHTLAAERHDLEYFKEILKNFMEARAAELEAKEAAKAAKKAEKAEKANKQKRKSKAPVDEDADGDIEMADAPGEPDSEDAEVFSSEKKNKKKRKASDDDEDSPKTDSVKKPKTTINLKLTSTPKATNGSSTPKSTKDSTAKAVKPKARKAAKAKEAPEVVAAPKEPELSPEEKRAKKEKEILFLRHKLQKGLLTKDQAPKEAEMQQMSEFVNKLEGYADLEVSIIRATKINKVLKAILKLTNIPKEEEFQFKPRSQSLLDKWNKLLASEQGTPVSAVPPTTANGVKEDSKAEVEDTKITPTATSNGTKESSADEKVEEKAPVVEEAISEPKEDASKIKEAPASSIEENNTEPEPTPVESTA